MNGKIHLLGKATPSRLGERWLFHLIQRNKHKELSKIRKQKNKFQLKEQGKTSGKKKTLMKRQSVGEIQTTELSCTVLLA